MTIPPKLIGDFAVIDDPKEGYVILKPKEQIQSGMSWTKQGYPFYSGTATYSRKVNFDAIDKQVWVEVDEIADMVEFIINSKTASIRPWAPYSCEISSLIKSGENTIALKVTNSMKNFLEGETKPSGLLSSFYIKISNK